MTTNNTQNGQLSLDQFACLPQHESETAENATKSADDTRTVSPEKQYESHQYINDPPKIDIDPVEDYRTAVTYINNLKNSIITPSGDDERSVTQRVVDMCGKYDGKNVSPVSLSSHILNVTFSGLSIFAYDLVVHGFEDVYTDEQIKTFMASLLLHDVNKYVNNAYDESYTGNSREVLEKYFEDDDFGIMDTLATEDDFDELLYLILHCESGEDTSDVMDVEVDLKMKDLARYVRAADACCSAVQRQTIREGRDVLARKIRSSGSESPVCFIPTYQSPTPVLQEIVMGTCKKAIEGHFYDEGAFGVVIGSTQNGILYLGEQLTQEQVIDLTNQYVRPEIHSVGEFSAKFNWQSFEYDVLSEVDFPVEEKREIITEQVKQRLHQGHGVDDSRKIEQVPSELEPYIPDLVHRIWYEKDHTVTIRPDGGIYSPHLAGVKSRAEEKSNGPQGFKMSFLFELVSSYRAASDDIIRWACKYRNDVDHILDVPPTDSDISKIVTSIFDPSPFESASDGAMIDSSSMCFICGERATERYSKGSGAIHQSQGFSKRTEAYGQYKRICQACNLEYSMLQYRIDKQEHVYEKSKLSYLYIHPSRYVSYISDESTTVRASVSKGNIKIENPTVTELFETQTQIIPMDMGSQKKSETHTRMKNVSNILKYIEKSGTRATLGDAYQPTDHSRKIFEDENPTRLQTRLGLDVIETRDDLQRALDLFDILEEGSSDYSNYYTVLTEDSFLSLASFAVDSRKVGKRISTYISEYHTEEFMDMKTLARRGVEVHGKVYGSDYKKSKVIRAAINSLIDAKSRGMEQPQLQEMVAGEVYDVSTRNDFAGHVTHEQANAFVDALIEYLSEYGYYDVQSMVDNINPISNAYIVAFDEVQNEEDEDEDVADSTDDDTTQTVIGNE